MSANTKYQAAPQRDSFEESNYTQAPPSYQAEASSQSNLLGQPRGEDDNVPDDFKVSYFEYYMLVEIVAERRSLEAPSRKLPSLSVCSSCARYTRSCKLDISTFWILKKIDVMLIGLYKSLPLSRSAQYRIGALVTNTGSSQTHG